MDPRSEKLANLVLDYSIKIKPQDRLLLQYDPAFEDYANLIAMGAEERGAQVRRDTLTNNPEFLRELLLKKDSSGWQEELARRIDLAGWCNTRVLIDAQENTSYAAEISPSRISELATKIAAPYRKILYRKNNNQERVRWNICAYPSNSSARLAGMTFENYSDLIFSSCLRDWSKLEVEMQKVKNIFDNAKLVEILDEQANSLKFSLTSRRGEVSSATHNMPSGEVFYGPEENSINGKIYFGIPSVREGQIIKGINLEFKDGKVIDYFAEKNKEFLDSVFNEIKGSRGVGEFGIGCNYGIKKATGNLMLDEKIGGTIHLALGNAISRDLNNGGGLNKADIHWDLVSDLVHHGRITVDGKVIQENGVWVFK